MKQVKVILKRSVDNLGESGQVVTVKAGFARNYLLPQDLAYEASEANMLRIEAEHRVAEERAKRDFLEGRRQVSQLEGQSLVFTARASEEGRLFGSISAADIAARLNELSLDFEVQRKQVLLEEALKQVGAHNVVVRLLPDVETEIEIQVVPEEG